MINNQNSGASTPLWTLFRSIEELRTIDQELPSQTAATFLYVCLHEGCTMKQIADSLGLAQSTMSRNISALSKVHPMNKPGHDLVRAEEDPYERRRKIVSLTAKGRHLKDRLLSIS